MDPWTDAHEHNGYRDMCLMIRNPSRLYEGCPPGLPQHYALRIIEHFLLAPLGEVRDLTITSAYRSQTVQSGLYALDPAKAARKAKGISQHILGEAVDFVPEGDMQECFLWCLDHLRPWQAILEYDAAGPEVIHLSIPSSIETIRSKRLLHVGGLWRDFDGTFPIISPGGAAA